MDSVMDDLKLFIPDIPDGINASVREIHRKQRILDACERYPQAFRLRERAFEPAETGWASYRFDGSCDYCVKLDHPEALAFLKQSFEDEKEAIMSQALTKKEDEQIQQLIKGSIQALRSVLPKHVTPERMARIAYSAITRNPKLARCTPVSLFNAIIEASVLGLEVNTPLGQASLVPFNNKWTKKLEAQLIPEYKGKIELAYRSGMVKSFQAHPVYEKDLFHYNYGLNPDLVHRPSKEADRGKLVAAYAVVNYLNGGVDFEVIEESEAMKAKAKSAAKDSKDSPWNTEDEPAMWVKTAVHRLFKRVPKSPEYQQLARAQELAEQADRGEAQNFDWLDAEFSEKVPAGIIPPTAEEPQTQPQTPPSPESAPEREAPEDPVWAQLDAMQEAVPDIYEEAVQVAIKKGKATTPIVKKLHAMAVMTVANELTA